MIIKFDFRLNILFIYMYVMILMILMQ